MCLFFQSKQTEHMHNLIVLAPSHDYCLIGRSMIEGICLLEYANNNKDQSAKIGKIHF